MKKVFLSLLFLSSFLFASSNSNGIIDHRYNDKKKGDYSSDSLYINEYISKDGTHKCLIFIHYATDDMSKFCYKIEKDN